MPILRSEKFDDIYFSAEDGLLETEYVFLKGNNLPAAWKGKPLFTIAETGFGTGLNFLTTVKSFEQTSDKGSVLHYISFEKYPLDPETITEALSPWNDVLGDYIKRLNDVYPLRIGGWHRIKFADNIFLTLIFDDMNRAIEELHVPRGVDAWFLDGFAPSKNPDMWSDTLFSNMARLSHNKTTCATFTAARKVRDGLEDAGFDVTKQKGFGKKRDMVVGRYAQPDDINADNNPASAIKKVAVIGGGLAGTACAYILKAHGITPTIFEKNAQLASGASGNDTGLYNPRFSKFRSPESDFYASAFGLANLVLGVMDDIDFGRDGCLHLYNSDDKSRRFDGLLENWQWHHDHMQKLSSKQASEISGIQVDDEALYLPDSGSLSPKKLCETYGAGTDIHYKHNIEDLEDLRRDYDAVIFAGAASAIDFDALSFLPVHTVRGQITSFATTEATQRLKSNICYSGYVTKAKDGQHVAGSTFQKWLTDTDVRTEDNTDNLEKLCAALPSLSEQCSGMKVTDARAALRTSSKDRLPVIGRVPDFEDWKNGGRGYLDDVYISTAHGSHGILSSLMGAHMIADMITDQPYCLPQSSFDLVSPDRFLKRDLKKGKL